jgi:hypothetical protein
MVFTQEDFDEHSQRLQLIIMCKMNKPALTRFSQLNEIDKKKFNKLLNSYILSLPTERDEWMDKLVEDFNVFCCDNIFTDDFDPSNYYVKDVNVNPELLS